ncbi:MAG: hypothetical protein D6730_04425 [Bacteroidetes bacterium]|nr:MAG: hypothetical protein D6730_04425 [Bacteroidota bacterium]
MNKRNAQRSNYQQHVQLNRKLKLWIRPLLLLSIAVVAVLAVLLVLPIFQIHPPVNDERASALLIPASEDWCSRELYTSLGATPDGRAASCGEGGEAGRVWFKFQASRPQVTITLKTNGRGDQIRNAYISLWDEAGTELQCTPPVDSKSGVQLTTNELQTGRAYYLAVSNVSKEEEGTFELCLSTQGNYDFRESAVFLADVSDWCSEDARFSTLWATADGPAGSCWKAGPNYNRWFRFQATTPHISIQVESGEEKGSLLKPLIALWNDEGKELACTRFVENEEKTTLNFSGLTPGKTYFFEIDNHAGYAGAYRGSFTLCVDDEVGYDFRKHAHLLSNITNWCSEQGAFSTQWATGDGAAGSCQQDEPHHNRWFKFQATAPGILVQLKPGQAGSSIQKPFLVLEDEWGLEIACAKYVEALGTVALSSQSLSPGSWYYLAVDNEPESRGGHTGSFSLCVNSQADNDFKEAAEPLPATGNWCSGPGAFSTLWASADGRGGSCWQHPPAYNRWFSFTATAPKLRIELQTGGANGSIRFPVMAVWDEAGQEVGCAAASQEVENLQLELQGLKTGSTYFLSVDNNPAYEGVYRGSFSLCIKPLLSP